MARVPGLKVANACAHVFELYIICKCTRIPRLHHRWRLTGCQVVRKKEKKEVIHVRYIGRIR